MIKIPAQSKASFFPQKDFKFFKNFNLKPLQISIPQIKKFLNLIQGLSLTQFNSLTVKDKDRKKIIWSRPIFTPIGFK